MSAYTGAVGDSYTRIRCDATGCSAEVYTVGTTQLGSQDRARAQAKRLGWQEWASHSVRHYCPEHGPRPGHSMRLLYGAAREATRDE